MAARPKRQAAARGEPDLRARHFTPEQRERAVEALNASGQTVREFARNFGVSEPTLYLWRKRHEEGGAAGLSNLTGGPKKPRGQRPLSAAVKGEIVSVRERFPTFGWRKIRDFLARFAGVRVSTGSVRKTLREKNLARQAPVKRRHRKPPKVKTFERARPGELWQTDITYLYLPGDSRPLYLVAFLDDFSRYVVSFGLHTHMKGAIVIEALLEGIAKFGRPKEVLSDQGRQYFAWRGKTDFQKLLRREGIEHVVARSHHPMTVGKTERFWATLKQEFWDLVRPKDLFEARERLAHFVLHYNHGRPHQSLEGLTPADRFFGASSEVRKAIEKAMDENEMRLALDQPLRKPLFLVGQIGDQSVSLHGEKGRVVIQTSDGKTREIGMEDLGMPPAKEAAQVNSKKENGHGGDDVEPRGGGAPAGGAPESKEAHEGEGAVALPRTGQGALGECVGRGEGAGAQDDGGDARSVARKDPARGGGKQARGAAGEVLADESAGGGGDAGGALEAARGASPSEGRPLPGGGSGAPEEGTGAASGRTRGREEPDLDPSRDAGEPGGAGQDDAAGDGRWEKTQEGGASERRGG